MSALLNPIFQRGEESVFTLQLERYFRNQGEIQDSPFTRSVLFGEFMDFGDGIQRRMVGEFAGHALGDATRLRRPRDPGSAKIMVTDAVNQRLLSALLVPLANIASPM